MLEFSDSMFSIEQGVSNLMNKSSIVCLFQSALAQRFDPPCSYCIPSLCKILSIGPLSWKTSRSSLYFALQFEKVFWPETLCKT